MNSQMSSQGQGDLVGALVVGLCLHAFEQLPLATDEHRRVEPGMLLELGLFRRMCGMVGWDGKTFAIDRPRRNRSL